LAVSKTTKKRPDNSCAIFPIGIHVNTHNTYSTKHRREDNTRLRRETNAGRELRRETHAGRELRNSLREK
jgi:hypothetical protein